tara:strand:- start:2908 stop:3396 length:489 start_codon:yes stop_codon:yes gene_type:complete
MKKLCLITFVLAASSLLSFTLHAQSHSEALTECRLQQNALKRLVCYDEIKLNQTEQAAQATPTQPATSSAEPTAANSDFGLEHKKVAEQQKEQLALTVSSISYSPRKELIIEFDNGQTWRQTGSQYYKIELGEHHHIKRGMLGSFILGNDENNRTIKVRRVN